ncbi:hydroxymethylbilane synthase [Roseivirga echinicomitans]
MKIRIGTRGSKLAMWQAHFVEAKLIAAGAETEIFPIETKGDRILDVSISKIGSKGVFTEEIEEQLADGTIDIAVHSAKDMQSVLPEGFELISFSEREVPNDVLISNNKKISLNDKNLVVGTSSNRRIATLKQYYPHIKTVPVRGNLQTRIKRMEDGACDALLLAYAGVHRMGYLDKVVQKLSLTEFTPAVGQGSVTVEVHKQLSKEKRDLVRNALNHKPTEICLNAERAFLKTMDGGCSIPVFGLAQIKDESLQMTGGIMSLDGKEMIRKVFIGKLKDAKSLGKKLAEEVLSSGGDRILKAIKTELSK